MNYNITNFIVGSCLSVILVMLVSSVVETKYFPVISDFYLTNIKPVELGWTEIYGRFEKHRDCALNNLSMYYKSGSSEVLIQYIWLEPPQIRMSGSQTIGPWRIQVPITSVSDVQIVATHKCHMFYNTVSVVGFVDVTK